MEKISKAELIEMIKNPGDAIGLKFGIDMGFVLLTFKGTWDSKENYTPLDLVEYEDEAYVSRSKNGGIKPIDSDKDWMPFDEFDKLVPDRNREEKRT